MASVFIFHVLFAATGWPLRLNWSTRAGFCVNCKRGWSTMATNTEHTSADAVASVPSPGDVVASAAQYEIVLFYKYVDVPSEPERLASAETGQPGNVQELQDWLERRGGELNLLGRVIIAVEGINGNLASATKGNIATFCQELAQLPLFRDAGQIDFKLDASTMKPFPDLFVQTKKEICSTGHAMPKALLDQGLGGTHLSPKDFHAVLEEYWGNSEAKATEESDSAAAREKELVVIDVRNNVEYNTGRFMNAASGKEALNPKTQTFSHWATTFADKAAEGLKDKKVLMYCTGGIRCEKASAYLRSKGIQDVSQLSGGIHRYIEEFGADGFFKGSNFVFDSRCLQKPEGAQVVGKCFACEAPTETVSGDRICAVCREPVLVCDTCRVKCFGVYYCEIHEFFKDKYEPFLGRFTLEQLEDQKATLLDLMKDKSTPPARRKPVGKQVKRLCLWIERRKAAQEQQTPLQLTPLAVNPRCRSCGRVGPKDLLSLMDVSVDEEEVPCCDGQCSGFSKSEYEDPRMSLDEMNRPDYVLGTKKRKRRQKNYRDFAKRMRDETEAEYLETEYTVAIDPSSGVAMRCVAPYLFVFQTHAKLRWSGKPLLEMYTSEFSGNKRAYYEKALQAGIITVDGERCTSERILRQGQLISNTVHRHEPPVQHVNGKNMIIAETDRLVVVDKPASITIHPSGAFRRNSLTFILAVECGLPRLFPVYRLDRLTSGVVLLAKDADFARQLGEAMVRKSSGAENGTTRIHKAYLARVHGRFLSSGDQVAALAAQKADLVPIASKALAFEVEKSESQNPTGSKTRARYEDAVDVRNVGIYWENDAEFLSAPDGISESKKCTTVESNDHVVLSWPMQCVWESTGVWRCIDSEVDVTCPKDTPRASMSRIRLLAYDEASDTSLVQCEPVTGRTHQLRVHLSFLGFPIVNDPVYGRGGDLFAGSDKAAAVDLIRQEKIRNPELPPQEVLDSLVEKGDKLALVKHLCVACNEGDQVAFTPEQMQFQGVDLHAFRYKVDLPDGEVIDFFTKLPPFAQVFAQSN